MCGIFGLVIPPGSDLRTEAAVRNLTEQLFLLSESRGKEAAGLVLDDGRQLAIYKCAVSARSMIRTPGYRALMRDAVRETSGQPVALIGHSRLVTDGSAALNRNNQPVHSGGIIGIHNGIVVNCEDLWRRHERLERQSEVDSEVIFALIRDQLSTGLSLQKATQETFRQIKGAASIAALFDDRETLLAATNTGSLYYRLAADGGAFVFASERYIIDRVAAGRTSLEAAETVHVRAGLGAIIDLITLQVRHFTLEAGNPEEHAQSARSDRRLVIDRSPPASGKTSYSGATIDLDSLKARFPYKPLGRVLRRCKLCVLPETMPFVDFDSQGVCAYCRSYRRVGVRGRDELEALCTRYRRGDGRPDCLVGVSGGRDSMYGLHYLKTELGMTPVAYTYDWGMVTDLARRNISRICGKLGIEHILVSANIPQKRKYIRKNVEAWLARPSLGTVPLFMAGDKAYFYHLQKTQEQLGVGLSFLCENPLERTDFKTGFAGVKPAHDPDHAYTLPLSSKLQLARFYASEIIGNPRYVNTSLVDTTLAFGFYYLIRRDYKNLYRYIEWDEKTIVSTLRNEYEFELATDTESAWRIGDGTAPFYNYIYRAVAGFSENDTLRSNQIRVGSLLRDEALRLIDRDNQPRFPSIKWYLDAIGLRRDLADVIETIERIPKLYAAT